MSIESFKRKRTSNIQRQTSENNSLVFTENLKGQKRLDQCTPGSESAGFISWVVCLIRDSSLPLWSKSFICF